MAGPAAPADWRGDPAVRAVMAALGADAGEARFVGGCVRDALLGLPPGDIDIATAHPPEEATRRLRAAGLGARPTGFSHGTVTAVAAGRSFEVTTLRRDVETDGRRAVVAFTRDWAEDARRRDFTMNALSMAADGTIHDPVGGAADIAAGRVRFVGDPARRIAEDRLRVLRFYRFHALYGRGPMDGAARAACRAAAPGLDRLSGERAWAELSRLLGAADPAETVRAAGEDGVIAALLGAPARAGALARLVALEDGAADPLRRLAALAPAPAAALAARLRLSGAERARLAAMRADRLDAGAEDADGAAARASLYRMGRARFADAALLTGALDDGALEGGAPEEGAAGRARARLELARSWEAPAFPLRGGDLLALGMPEGAAVGRLLARIEARWIAGDFRAGRGECLAWAREAAAGERTPGGGA